MAKTNGEEKIREGEDAPVQAVTVSTGSKLTTAESEAVDQLLQMDVQKLTQEQTSKYLFWLAKRRGLDPMTKPFDLITLQGKRVVYANAGCADQLREIHRISIEVLEEGPLRLGDQVRPDVYIVKVKASLPDGRSLIEVGGAGIENQTGENLWIAIAKSYTRAQRRATLGLCGLGVPDISELGEQVGAGGSQIVGGQRRLFPSQSSLAPDLPSAGSSSTAIGNMTVIPPATPPINLPKAR